MLDAISAYRISACGGRWLKGVTGRISACDFIYLWHQSHVKNPTLYGHIIWRGVGIISACGISACDVYGPWQQHSNQTCFYFIFNFGWENGSGTVVGDGGIGAFDMLVSLFDFSIRVRHICITAGRSQEMCGLGAPRGEAGQLSRDEEHYCTSPRVYPPANWDRVSIRNRSTAFCSIQAAFNTALAGEGHGHERCRGPGEKDGGFNGYHGPGLYHDNDNNPLPSKSSFSRHPKPRNLVYLKSVGRFVPKKAVGFYREPG